MTRRGLGRGLGALIPGADEGASPGSVSEIEVSRISPNPFQPRREISGPEFDDLVSSVRRHGVIQPVITRQAGSGYELVAGERRWRAAQAAGLASVPAVVRELSDQEMLELALIENLRREDLNPMERAAAYRRLGDEFGMTQEEISDVVGSSRSSIANTIRLLELPNEVQAAIGRGRISEGHGRALLAVQDRTALLAAWKIVEEKGLNVRETEELSKASGGNVSRETRKRAKAADPELSDIARQIGERYATTAQISSNGKSGSIQLRFFSDTDLERLIDLLMR